MNLCTKFIILLSARKNRNKLKLNCKFNFIKLYIINKRHIYYFVFLSLVIGSFNYI